MLCDERFIPFQSKSEIQLISLFLFYPRENDVFMRVKIAPYRRIAA